MPQILVAGKESFEEKGKFSYVVSLILIIVREELKLFQVISKEVSMSPWRADFDSSSNFNHNSSRQMDGWVDGWMSQWVGRVGGLADGWMERRRGGKKGEREGARKIRKGRKMNDYLFPTPSLNAIVILCF